MIEVEAATRPFGYRNRITVHSGPGGELGFFADDNRTVVDVERCLIANDAVNRKLASLRERGNRPRHATLTDTDSHRPAPAGSFEQVNTEMADRLLDWLRRQFAGRPGGSLLDLYCGAGFFGLGLAEHFTDICGVDRDGKAIHAATFRAASRGIHQARFFAAAVEDRLSWFLGPDSPQWTTILVDPPRTGLPGSVSATLARTSCERLIYVSCDPATLARDLKILIQTGKHHTLGKLALFDMFPQTAHIETVALLQRAL